VGIGYWPVIGMFLALLLCLASDRKRRRTLLFGAGGGILVGCLNLLAIAKTWYGDENNFGFLDQPANPLRNAIKERIDDERLFRTFHGMPTSDVPYWRLTYVGYWLIIGLLLALIVCAIQILRKRKVGAAKRVSGESNPAPFP